MLISAGKHFEKYDDDSLKSLNTNSSVTCTEVAILVSGYGKLIIANLRSSLS